MLKPLVKKAKKNIGNKKIKRVYGDGAYDSRENFNYLNSKGNRAYNKNKKKMLLLKQEDILQELRK